MIVTFDIFMNGKKENTINIVVRDGIFKTTRDLVKEVKFLASEFKTHCSITGGSYHPAHFINYLNKYTNLNVMYLSPTVVERLDL